jgi:hypothetical protein
MTEPTPRNMLTAVKCESFNMRSESEIADEMKGDKKFFDSIPEYGEEDQPSEEDIRTVEKVLKYAAGCNYMGFSEKDAILVNKYSTNVLRWSLNYG